MPAPSPPYFPFASSTARRGKPRRSVHARAQRADHRLSPRCRSRPHRAWYPAAFSGCLVGVRAGGWSRVAV